MENRIAQSVPLAGASVTRDVVFLSKATPGDDEFALWLAPSGIEQAMAGQLIGSRPVRLEIAVTRFVIPSVASRILVGSDPQMFASATLVDARTGATIVTHPKLTAFRWPRAYRHRGANSRR